MKSKYHTTDDTLQELWDVKAETAKRYKTAANYFAHLSMGQVAKAKSPLTTKRPSNKVETSTKTVFNARNAVPA